MEVPLRISFFLSPGDPGLSLTWSQLLYYFLRMQIPEPYNINSDSKYEQVLCFSSKLFLPLLYTELRQIKARFIFIALCRWGDFSLALFHLRCWTSRSQLNVEVLVLVPSSTRLKCNQDRNRKLETIPHSTPSPCSRAARAY